MNSHRSSLTAEAATFLRASHFEWNKENPIFSDPYAIHFLTHITKSAVKIKILTTR